MYAKLNQGVLEYAPLNYTLSDGRVIVNFNKSEVLMKRYGFKLVVDEKPSYDNTTQYLSVQDYSEEDTTITVNYEIYNILIVPTVEERLASVEEVILNLL